MCSFQNTPEKLLIRFCERAKVIGISATATVPTVIGNFDLNYLRNKMQGAFYQMPASEYRRLKQDFISTQSGYRHISIHTQLLGATTYSLQTWEDIFNDKDLAENSYELLENEVYKDDRNSSYNLERYARIAMAFKAFLQHDDIKSMLCLLTKHPAQNDKFLNSEILNKILSPIAGFRPKQKNKYIEYLKGDNFDSKKESILTRLANGEKLFVISTYQTIGAGQNLQYKIPAELQGKLVCSNKFSPREEKDFDAIYLDKPTNLFVNMEPNWWEENFVKYLFQVEFLQENRELSITDTLKHVRKAFRCYAQGNVPKEYVENVYDRQSIRMYSTRAVVQAIGRICRTNQKNPNIYIFADDRIADYLDLTVTEGRILNHEFMALVKKIEGTQKNAPIYGSLENGADLVSNRAGRDIDNILNDSWTEGRIKKWQELRQIVLRFPTVSTEEVKKNFIFSNYYVELPQKSNVLYYTQESDFRKINISFGRTQLIHFAEDESGTRLDRIMRWDSLRNFFQSKGYATSFKPNDYIMSPPIWNNIYKGALGEKVGKFWFAQVLNITLEEINEPEKFELFDFKVPGIPAYVDFKNWDETSEMDWDTAVDKIQKKAVKSGCKCVIIANIITRSQYRIQRFPKDNFEFLIVPSLLRDNESITIDRDAANAIRRFLDDCTN